MVGRPRRKCGPLSGRAFVGTYALGITQIRCGFSPFLTVTLQETDIGDTSYFPYPISLPNLCIMPLTDPSDSPQRNTQCRTSQKAGGVERREWTVTWVDKQGNLSASQHHGFTPTLFQAVNDFIEVES